MCSLRRCCPWPAVRRPGLPLVGDSPRPCSWQVRESALVMPEEQGDVCVGAPARGFRGGWTDVCVCTFVCMAISACELLCLRVRACARVHEPPLRVPVPRVSRVMGRASRKSPRTMRVQWMPIVCEYSVLTHSHLSLPSSLLFAFPPAAASNVPLLCLSPSLPTPLHRASRNAALPICAICCTHARGW